jgi:hypothetical protein
MALYNIELKEIFLFLILESWYIKATKKLYLMLNAYILRNYYIISWLARLK